MHDHRRCLTIDSDFVAKSPPDGYTLLFGSMSTQKWGRLVKELNIKSE